MSGEPIGTVGGFDVYHLKDKTPDTLGVLVPGVASGALPNGTRITKTKSDETDAHADGALGTVRASHTVPGIDMFAYFVEWDDQPGVPVFIAGNRVEAAP